MELKEYFENAEGVGTLSTSDDQGNVNSAMYARPHVMDDGTLAFIMSEKLTHENITKNPSAVYLFKEKGAMKGKRVYLEKVNEEKDCELVNDLRRKKDYPACATEGEHTKYVVYFKVKDVLPLVGTG